MKKKILSIVMLVAMFFSFSVYTAQDKLVVLHEEVKAEEKKEVKKEVKKDDCKEEKEADTLEGEYLVTAEYVKENLENDKVIIVDARGEEVAIEEGTVPGAIAFSWPAISDVEDKELGEEGWGHILEPEVFSEKLSALGLDMDKEIILFANGKDGGGDDGRILWQLLAAGYENVKIVNGGIDAIEAAGVELVEEVAKPKKAKVEIKEIDYTHVIDTAELSETIDDYKVVDVRDTDEYEGAEKFGEAKGGHIPGAIHIQFIDLFREDNMLKSKEEIIEMYKEAGVELDDEIVTYCTGGIRSGFTQIILQMCGFENVKNYQGSYYCWCVVNEVEK